MVAPQIDLSLIAEYLVERYQASDLHIKVLLAPDREALVAASDAFIVAFGAAAFARFKRNCGEAMIAAALVNRFGTAGAEVICAGSTSGEMVALSCAGVN